MRMSLFPFQEQAVKALQEQTKSSLSEYQREPAINRVISLQAPTGSGKTIIMAAFIESIYHGTVDTLPNQKAIFVWLSDSPTLNEQSKDKLEQTSDFLRLEQYEIIDESSFDQEMLTDGKIYFLNTQKLAKRKKLVQHADTRQYTIWETLTNTVKNKSDRLYFVIDEAHRGMQSGEEAGKATSIMQRFIKGYPKENMPAMPLIIGMSATPERFNKLVLNADKCSIRFVQVEIEKVRTSGLLKDRIIVKYPGDMNHFNEAAMLQAATQEWLNKCQRWQDYTQAQNLKPIDPIFVLQVASETEKEKVSATDLTKTLQIIEEQRNKKFTEGEVVHTFGSIGDVTYNGLTIHHVEPQNIADNHKIRVVFFKENLSTGWDCPRAETMMSFRHAQDATYIAQLLGRMIRTPLGKRITSDETLNDVSLFLPYYDETTVHTVVDELKSSEGGDIPTVIDEENMSQPTTMPWSIYIRPHEIPNPNQGSLPFASENLLTHQNEPSNRENNEKLLVNDSSKIAENSSITYANPENKQDNTPYPPLPKPEQLTLLPELNRKDVLDFINTQGFLTYTIRLHRIKNYLESLLNLASLLTISGTQREANNEVKSDIVQIIHDYADSLRVNGRYEKLKHDILKMKLSVQMYDAFGKNLQIPNQSELFISNKVLEQQLSMAVVKLGRREFVDEYFARYQEEEGNDDVCIDCILFAANSDCLQALDDYAKRKFHDFINTYRLKIANKSTVWRQKFSEITTQGDAVSQQILELPVSTNIGSSLEGKKYYRHLYIDKDGTATIKLNRWEQDVIDEESERRDFVCWLRNPARASWALTVPYMINNEIKAMYPDFLIVRSNAETKYVVDILEPHGDQYKDNLQKAKGLVDYARKEPRIGRIQMIRALKNPHTGKQEYRRLDLTDSDVQELVNQAINNEEFDHIFAEKSFVSKPY